MKLMRTLMILLITGTVPALTACGTVALSATGATSSTPTTATAAVDLQATVKQFLALTADQQVQLAKSLGSLDLLDWAQQNQSASSESKQTSVTALLTAKPTLNTQLAASFQRGAQGQMGAPGGPGGMGGPGGGPGGLPPNIEAIRTQYPELATALEAMQSLSPEERRTKMDALITAHPEWQTALAPPGGMGPGGPPPSGMPPAGAPASPQAAASVSP